MLRLRDIVRQSPLIIAAVFGVLIQTQVTIGRSEADLGLTLNLADFMLPFLGIWVVYSLFCGYSIWPKWQDRWTDVMMILLTAYFLFSAGYAYFLTGALSPWAVVNRLLGWGVVVGYFYLGGWAVTRYGDRPFLWFTQFLALGCFGAALIEGAGITLSDMYPNTPLAAYPLDGAMGNRNAFAFLFMAAYGALAAIYRHQPDRLLRVILIGFHFFLPSFFFLNGSRVLFFLLPVMYVIVWSFLWRSVGVRFLIVPLIVGAIFSFALSTVTGETLREEQLERVELGLLIDPTAQKIHPSDDIRAVVNHDAWERFQENPVFGMGLGQFLVWQKAHYGRLIDLIDSIPLWILTEMGGIGFFLFSVFGVRLMRAIFQARSHSAMISDAAFFVIFVFLVMGAVHQLFYARVFWLVLGAAVARGQYPDKPFLSSKNSLP